MLNISGVCIGSDQWVQQLNEATERLMEAGDWWNTLVKARVCTDGRCVTWPRWVGTLKGVWPSQNKAPIQNGWYDFMPMSGRDWSVGLAGARHSVTFVNDGLSPVVNNVPCGTARYVRVYTRFRKDDGLAITFYGTDSNGQKVMTRDALKNWQEGETLTLGLPYSQTVTAFREVERVSKAVTAGPLDVYQADDAGVLYDLAHYDGGETEPMYQHSKIQGGLFCCYSASGVGAAAEIQFYAKLKFVPVVSDSDRVQIDNIQALKLAIQSGKLQEAGDFDSGMKTFALAIKQLNLQLRDKVPLDQIPIDFGASGTALPRFAAIGCLR